MKDHSRPSYNRYDYEPLFLANSLFVAPPHIRDPTLWAACRAVIFGSIVIVLGMFMTVIGYFDVDLAQEEAFNKETGENEWVVNLTKRYQLKSLQYIGPILMGIGSFILIIACVITLESRDKHAQIIHEESKEFRKQQGANAQAGFNGQNAPIAVPTTAEDIRNWRPKYLQLPRICPDDPKISVQRKFSSTSCIPRLLQNTDTRKLYDRLVEDYYTDVYHEVPKAEYERYQDSVFPGDELFKADNITQNIVAEVHIPPRASLSSSNSVFASPSPTRRSRDASPSPGDDNRRQLASATTPTSPSVGANNNNLSDDATPDVIVIKQAPVLVHKDLPFIETTTGTPKANIKLAYPKCASKRLAYGSSARSGISSKTAPIAQIDVDLPSSSSCSSPEVQVHKLGSKSVETVPIPCVISTAAPIREPSEDPTARLCTLLNGMEIR